MGGEILKQFLVGLGFSVDDSSMAKFNKSIQQASVRVAALYGSIKVLAAGVFASIANISKGFEDLGYEFRLIAPNINKTLVLRREMLKAYSAAGVNIYKTIQESVKFNMALAKTQMTFKAIFGGVAAKFFPLLTKQMDIFRGKIYANMPQIIAALEKFVNFVFKAFETTVLLGTRIWTILQRVYDFFYLLHKQTDGWSSILLAVVAAWKLLNLSFLATPLGMLIAGLVAIIALWDDFQVWREGGKSLFDWSSFIPVIDSVAEALNQIYVIFDKIVDLAVLAGMTIYKVFTGDFAGAFKTFELYLIKIKDLFLSIIGYWGKALNVVGSVGGWAASLFGGGEIKPTQEQMQKWAPQMAQPAGVNTNNNTNQNVKQQTNITVSAGANANETAQAVATQQSRVNFDMVRNMRGATR